MGVKTKLFGPHAWKVFEGVADFYDEFMTDQDIKQEDKKRMEIYANQFFLMLGYVVPCIYCRISYRHFVCPDAPDNKYLNIEKMLHRKKAKQFVYHLHNRVNQKLQTQQFAESMSEREDRKIEKFWKKYIPEFDQVEWISIKSKRFWQHLIIFLGYMMCDYRKANKSKIITFLTAFGKMLSLSQPLSDVTKSYYHVFCTLHEVDFNSIDERLHFIWNMKKVLYKQQNWKYEANFDTIKKFSDYVKAGRVGCA